MQRPCGWLSFIWSKKDEFCFQTEALHEKEAIDAAFDSIEKGQYPVFLSDSGDQPHCRLLFGCDRVCKNAHR